MTGVEMTGHTGLAFRHKPVKPIDAPPPLFMLGNEPQKALVRSSLESFTPESQVIFSLKGQTWDRQLGMTIVVLLRVC